MSDPLVVQQIHATLADVSDVLKSEDPLQEVDSRLAAIDASIHELDAERAKWAHVRALAEIFMGTKSTANSGTRVKRENDVGRVRRRRAATALNDRQSAALRLMGEQPDREWRLREIVAGLTERQWLPHSQWLDNLLSKDLPPLVDRGLIERPMKGVYRLPGNRGSGVREETESESENGSQEGPGEAVRSSDLSGLAEPVPDFQSEALV